MLTKVSALLSVFQVISLGGSTNGYSFTDNKVLAANIYDDIALKNIEQRLDRLQTMNKNLRLDIESLQITLNQQLTAQRNEIIKGFEEIKAALTTQKESINSIDSEEANLIDTRGENLTIDENIYEFEDTTTQATTMQSIDSEEANLIDTRGESLTIDENIYEFEDITTQATTMQSLPTNCAEASETSDRNGVYKIKLPNSDLEPFDVYCTKDTTDMSDEDFDDTDSFNNTSEWLVIQRRQDGSTDFYRNWTDYQKGFGNLEGEFFIGLDKLHALTKSTPHELWIQMEDFESDECYAKYSSFAIGGENELYALNELGDYAGDAGDSLRTHKGMKWSTFDFDNDMFPNSNCALSYTGAWWYNRCHDSNLNGQYLRGYYVDGDYESKNGKGIDWYTWHYHTYSLKYVHMAIRPVQ